MVSREDLEEKWGKVKENAKERWGELKKKMEEANTGAKTEENKKAQETAQPKKKLNLRNVAGNIGFSFAFAWIFANEIIGNVISAGTIKAAFYGTMYSDMLLLLYNLRIIPAFIAIYIVFHYLAIEWSVTNIIIVLLFVGLIIIAPSLATPAWNMAVTALPQLNLLKQWMRPTEIGCRDCLQLTFNVPPSTLVEGNDYLFSVDLKNNDCPSQESNSQCTGKTLKNIKITGKAFDEKETTGETYLLGDLESSGETSKVIKIEKDKITSDIFDKKVFYLSVLSSYTIEITANTQIAIYQTAKERLAAGEISKGTTHAGPVDIGMNFNPNKISVVETTEVPLELDFLLVEGGTATIDSLEFIQHGDQSSRLQLLGCTKNGQYVSVDKTSEPTQEKYVLSMSELDHLSNYGSEVVLCNFAVSSATGPNQLTFESASSIKYYKEDIWNSEIELKKPSVPSSSSSSTSSTLPTGMPI